MHLSNWITCGSYRGKLDVKGRVRVGKWVGRLVHGWGGWVYLFLVHKWRVLGSTSVLLSRPKTKHKDTGRSIGAPLSKNL